MPVRVVAVGRTDVAPLIMSDRFRHEITYFMTPAGDAGAPERLGEREYWIRLEDARRTFDEGVFSLVSPLDSDTRAELEITEEQERWLEWMLEHEVQHVRIESA